MQRDPRAYLRDAREAAAVILGFVDGKSYGDYAGDRLLRSAVERQFEIIGKVRYRFVGWISVAHPPLKAFWWMRYAYPPYENRLSVRGR